MMDMMYAEIDKENLVKTSKENKKHDVKKDVDMAIIKLQECEYNLNLMRPFRQTAVPKPL